MENPLTPMFELQRTIVEQNRKLIDEGIDAQKNAFETFAEGIEGGQSLAERNVELSRNAMHAYIDSMEEVLPEDAADFSEIRATVDEGYDAYAESQSQAWESMVEAIEDSGQSYEEFVDNYQESIDSSFDSFLEQHERLEERLESVGDEIETPLE